LFLAPTTIGDVFGFVAVLLGGTSAFFMLIRGKLLKITRNLPAIRAIHVIISAGAGVFVILHVAYFYSYPITTGVLLGYAAFALSIAVWLTGTAFLEKVKDSLLFHSSFSMVFISLALIHAASANANIPPIVSELLIAATLIVIVSNVWYQLSKMKGGRKPASPVAQDKPKVSKPIG
jgi:hypothetical protein